MITLLHGNFVILGKLAKKYAQRTGCSNWVADWALQSQLFLDKMKKEHPGWNTACRQEWNLFLLEWMFHNATTMWPKVHQRCYHRFPLWEPSVTAIEHPSMQTLVGSRNADFLQVAEQIYKGEYMVAPSMFSHTQQEDLMKDLCRELSGHLTQTGLQGDRVPAELPSRSWRCSWGPEKEDQALEVKWQDRWSRSGRTRTHSRGQNGSRWQQSRFPLHPTWCQSPSPALHDPILMSSSTAPWKASSYNPSLETQRTGHCDETPPHRRRRNQGSRSHLRWTKSWVLNQTCLQTSPTPTS